MVPSSASGPAFIIILALVAAAMAGDFNDDNALYAGQRLQRHSSSQELRWGDYDMYLRPDCNLEIFKVGVGPIWHTQVQSYDVLRCSLHMQMDGNLVLYGYENKILWQTNTRGRSGENVCLLRQDGNVAIYGKPIWSTRGAWYSDRTLVAALKRDQTSSAAKLVGTPYTNGRYVQNVLYKGESLLAGQELRARSYRFIMQRDCNLVLYNGYQALWWTTNTAQYGQNCRFQLMSDGNLIMYQRAGFPVWQAGTARGDGDYVLILQNDGAVVLYSKALWSSGTITTSNSSSSSSRVADQGRKMKNVLVAAVNQE